MNDTLHGLPVTGGKADGIYPDHTPDVLLPLLNETDKLNERFVCLKKQIPAHSDLWRITVEKLRALWTYHSNAIEGSTMFLPTNQACEQPEHLTVQMQELTDYIAHCSVHPVLLAAVVHGNIFRIQLFDKDKGHSARVLMNMVLMQKGYLPAIFCL